MLSTQLLASDLQQRQSDLKQLQSQINKQQSDLQNTSKQREKLISLLKKDEKAIASAAKKVNGTQTSLAQTEKELTKLHQRQQTLSKLKKRQQESLSNQLASAYLAGNHDYSKMLLNQQNPATIERLLTYYQYLNNARMASINKLQDTIKELDQITQEQVSQKDRLNKLILDQQQQAQQLTLEQGQRQNTLVLLQKTLNSRGAKLEQLQIEQASLKRVVEQAIATMKNSPKMNGLSSKYKLSWPTKGRIESGFGSQRSGQVKWKGVTVAAPEGQVITAIAPGKVIYADWLRGFGMVLVVDHGKGYMSLYGHAQTLLKGPGDLVSKGESVALVGRSGGQTEAGLYFEVRHKGQAVDPARYCKR
ncbi:peptidoglycan DD-metalloendopeptidase family protein [Shewanella sp. D64]|uniref:murein hydrolase activator EnvC family protein n=1 Tax=unclassified Shewanella TaxID=196818 RepID=UPI0022BA7070|nr:MULTISPECIES: peptidoglycan DD-metalloendopeptidase family protein [unclassified Shewanella]MEC4726340.1 peptidoglycan DD-metalloendopeptidase family protein [Shewanella sp. D64]MEC4738352.1 peptidoglycan DD-metalloendopeptidase family protein [Shewanella sp. E94]WBJ95486.1 peptidoglycan DD-metalloendopeptidase family protein [Shewanella sp. MTB7]